MTQSARPHNSPPQGAGSAGPRRLGASTPTVTLKPGHVRPVWTGHPWVFAQAIARIEGGAVAGDEVTVVDPHGAVLGRGLYTPRSAIPVRMFTRDDTPIDGALFRRRIERAIQHRRDLGLPSHVAGHETTAYRLIHAEGDGMPGLVVDILGDVACVQLNTIGIKRREGIVFDALIEALAPRAIVDRTPPQLAKLEGYEADAGVVRGDATIDRFAFIERGLRYEIPLALGQKTGFYLDQRTLRARIEQLSHGRRVLDAFSFVGTFAMAAARGGAREVVAVDESAVALEVGAECARANGLHERIRFERSDARKALGRASQEGGFDVVICDPPKLSPTRGAKEGALGVYKALAAAGCRATKPGGIFVLCSCSSAVSLDDLTRAIALGARESRMHAVVFDRHFQGADHPVSAAFPEGLYLKSVIARLEAL
ncbi:class I SAM-dependent rRNA methyltransferase [Polyangium aurulentum]|uniref:class I SAM-dependent rRNA methyltransferase n=1 Tax=Polyangium aurulentum TaxID=2567896 RepID=UPI0010AE9876|nr:class I SAM-dependent rRNA methyltransferase [Polyangium aurulentum]UQA59681.1 class I SAM-dependent rRNA methyltransferase [Polyangium aurulentum]